MTPPPHPTGDQCSSHAEIRWHDGIRARQGFACWYPQMGGYAAVCVVELESTVGPDGPLDDPCFNAWVWHDGDFPFPGEGNERARSPMEIHHCAAEQFIKFGHLVQQFARRRLS